MKNKIRSLTTLVLATGVSLIAVAALAASDRKIAPSLAELDNNVSACVTVEPGATIVVRNLLLLPATLTWKQSIANCGCTSALLSYRVREKVTWRYFHEMVHGELIDMTYKVPGTAVTQFAFVLKTDRQVHAPRPVTLTFGCAAPD